MLLLRRFLRFFYLFTFSFSNPKSRDFLRFCRVSYVFSNYAVLPTTERTQWLCCCVADNPERLVLYSMIGVCVGLILLLLVVICHLLCRQRTTPRRRHLLKSSNSTNSDKKLSSRPLLPSTSTQTTPENASLLPPDSPDQTWVRSTSWPASPDRPTDRLLMADPSTDPSTLRSLPIRASSGPATVGDDLVWKTMDRQRPLSPNAGLYNNPYRHDTFRTIDTRSSKSPHK